MQSSSLTSRKLLVSVSFFGAALLLAGVAALVHSAFAEAALLHVAAVFLELALALTLIHFYLENRERREATSALLQLILPSVADAHNAVLEKAFAVYGKDEFRSLVSLYTSNKGDPSFLKPEDRERLYAIYKNNLDAFKVLYSTLAENMRELTAILGWSFDKTLLREVLECRFAVNQLLRLSPDDSPDTKLSVVEHFLDADIKAHIVYRLLKKSAGVTDE